MSRSRLLAMVVLSAVVIVSATVWTQAQSFMGNETPFGFGQRIAGAYASTLGPFGGALQFHADGTLVGVSNACCGSGAFENIQSEAVGNWARTGPRQIELSGVLAATYYDPVTHAPLPPLDCTEECTVDDDCTIEGAICEDTNDDGMPDTCSESQCVGGRQGVCIASEQINFAPDFESYTGTLVTQCWVENPAIAGIYGGTGGPLPSNIFDPDRPADLCTLDLLGFEIPIAGERVPAIYPICGELP